MAGLGVCLIKELRLFTVEMDGAAVVRHHSAACAAGVSFEVWEGF